jgi:hypothetical protein
MKMALCISGETRTWNLFDNQETIEGQLGHALGHDWMVKHWRALGWDIDVYGHTWDYCEYPEETDNIQFKKLTISNKDTEIGDWIRQDVLSRAVLHAKDFKDYPSPTTEFLIEESKAAWGQIFSNCLCMEQIDDFDEYDLVVRSRWDLCIEYPNSMEPVISHYDDMTFFIKNYSNMMHLFVKSNGFVDGCNLLLVGNSWQFFKDKFDISEDTFFCVTSGNAFINILKNKTWKQELHNLIEEVPLLKRCCSHDLWAVLWKGCSMIGYYGLPPVICLFREEN